jgi:hypothetical protein
VADALAAKSRGHGPPAEGLVRAAAALHSVRATRAAIAVSRPGGGLSYRKPKWGEHLATIEKIRLVPLILQQRYNCEWLIGRPGHRSPAAVREACATGIAA